jgi:S-formylglutathione hydrolase FrmB
MKYRILLPSGYKTETKRYPVLYLLHGLTGGYTNWDTRTKLRKYAAPFKLIVVMPDANNSWYMNSAEKPQDRFEDYIAEDLIAEIDQKYRTIATRESRAIGGLSMGGYGTLKFALKYPELFIFAASFSGAVPVAHDDFRPRAGEFYHQQLLQILGPVGTDAWKANDLFALAEQHDPSRLPYLWLTCGTSDRLLDDNRSLVARFQQRKIPYTYTEAPGEHSWPFWDDELSAMLRELARHMAISGAQGKE